MEHAGKFNPYGKCMKASFSTNRLWLCLPPLVAFVFDVSMTLNGQTVEYWDGDYGKVIEANPLAWLILREGPWHFLGFCVIWGILFCAILVLWQHTFARVLAFLWTFGHAIGGCSWLTPLGWPGYLLAIVILYLFERLLAFSWKQVPET